MNWNDCEAGICRPRPGTRRAARRGILAIVKESSPGPRNMPDTLAELIAGRSDPGAANATFRSSSRLEHGLRSEVRMRRHAFTVDAPAQFGGGDSGSNPVALVLGALGACREIT